MTLSVKKINTVSAEVKAFVENNKGKPVPHVDQPDQPTSPFFPVKIGDYTLTEKALKDLGQFMKLLEGMAQAVCEEMKYIPLYNIMLQFSAGHPPQASLVAPPVSTIVVGVPTHIVIEPPLGSYQNPEPAPEWTDQNTEQLASELSVQIHVLLNKGEPLPKADWINSLMTAINLAHEGATKAIESGITAVMKDGSVIPFAKLIADSYKEAYDEM